MEFGVNIYQLANADAINSDFCKRISKRKYDYISYSSFNGGRTVDVQMIVNNKIKNRIFRLNYVYLKEFANIIFGQYLGSDNAKTLKNETIQTLKTGYICKYYNTKNGSEKYYVFAESSAVYESILPKTTVLFVSEEYLKKEILKLPFFYIIKYFDELSTDDFFIQINKNNEKVQLVTNVESIFPVDVKIDINDIISFLLFMDAYFNIRGKYNEGTYDNDIINFPFVSVSGLSLNDVNFSFSILNNENDIVIRFHREEQQVINMEGKDEQYEK